MRVLVTGATGFLGGYIIDYFEKQGCEIVAVGRNSSKGIALKSPQTTFVCGDLTNADFVENLCDNIDIVVHASALSTIYGKYDDFYNANVLATEYLCRSALKHGVKRFVFVSSPSIYSENKDKFNIKEDDSLPKFELNYYIKTKKLAEKVVQEYAKKGLNDVIIRPRGLFGIGDTSLTPRIIDANKRIGIPLFFNGNSIVDITCVENVAYGLYLASTVPNVEHEIIHLSNGEPRKFREILEQLFNLIDESPNFKHFSFGFLYFLSNFLEKSYELLNIKNEPSLTRYTVCTLAFSQTLDLSKAKKLLGYKPLLSLDEGIEKYAKWKNSQ